MKASLLSVIAAFGIATSATAQETHQVQFETGDDNAAVEARVTSNAYVGYVLGAREGQTTAVSLITDGSAFFNILPPGSDGEAIYIGSTDGPEATGITLPSTGDDKIRAYLMGNARDTRESVPFTLSMAIM
ncbi:hypothetical protein [Qingshengfaniella alkalisoli]|uniref:Uncharacterized protein n=1 Tax=Qingshengfaniella alkalisoli TaxID=2599296 RepID=A0A5B8IV77_9RHOB|nr:hypothetical protein [Qingshengfaniella alkalisoli]QDY69343.1 hypothetical protein FPZ52_06670 [Qingshengfaniella alkalisoli]